jgi:membrane protease subunit HflK
MYLDAMQQIYTNVTKVMVDSRQGSNLLYLPLDKLLQNQGVPLADPSVAAGSVPAAAGGSQAVPAGVAVDPRARDSSRSRDRDTR